MEARRDRVQAQLDALDFGDFEELNETRRLIVAAEKSLEMARTADGGWWSHPEAPPMWFTEVLTSPGRSSDEPVHMNTQEDWAYDTIPPIGPDRIGKTLNEALNRLHGQVWASPGLLELRGTINLTVPPQDGVPVPGGLTRHTIDEPQALDTPWTSSPRT